MSYQISFNRPFCAGYELDEDLLQSQITERTRSIVPVPIVGVAWEMDRIYAIAKYHGIRVIEDNARALFARYRGRPLGSFGGLAAFLYAQLKERKRIQE